MQEMVTQQSMVDGKCQKMIMTALFSPDVNKLSNARCKEP